nr:DUF6583 family protein [Oceanobacillus massiliensis]
MALIAGVIVLAGGSAAAFMYLNASPKASYFLAEKNTLEYMTDQFENRYQPELDWYEKTQQEKTASTIELSGSYNDPAAVTGYGMDPAMFINNSSITIDAQSDMQNRQLYTGLSANIGGMEVSDIEFFLDEEKVMLGLPFIEEVLQFNDEDLGPLLQDIDPNLFTGEETLNLESLFDSAQGVLPEEDLEYLEEEYMKLIYDELPEEAFTSSDETIDVNEQSISAEKIALDLSEQELKDIMKTVLDKMENDDRLKEIIKEQAAAQQFGNTMYMQNDLDTLISDFDTAIADMKTGLEDFRIPDGLKSTLWIHDDKIVQRDFSIEMGPTAEELGLFTIKGSQLLTETNQFFNYDFSFSDAYSDGTVNLAGDLNWEDDQAKDSIKIAMEDLELSYEGSETLEDGSREFDRTFTLQEPTSGGGSLLWSGNASYENDQMNSEHNFSLETPDISQDMISFNIISEGKTIDSVESLSEDNVKNIGGMSADEIQQYIENDITPSFQQWLFGILAGGGLGF